MTSRCGYANPQSQGLCPTRTDTRELKLPITIDSGDGAVYGAGGSKS